MKKMNLNLLTVFISALMLVFVTSCKNDDNPTPVTNNKPVLDENFSFVVNSNTVTFTTTLDGNVWFTANEKDYQTADKTVDVFLAKAGTYSFTCSTIVDGEVLTSDPFDVVIVSDDLSFLETPLWKALSGGIGKTKTWRVDMNADGKCMYFEGPLYFSGYSDGDIRKTEWSYWAWDILPNQLPYTVNGVEMTSFFNWSPDYPGNTWIMSPNDYGTITFQGDDFSATTSIFGETKTGSFSFDTATWKLTLNGVILPIDTSRLNEGQYLDENLAQVRIFTLTDSAMQIGIKRSYEGTNEDGSHKVSEWVNIYNFICADYTYEVPEEFTYSESVKTSFAKADLVGTWKYADVIQGWIAWNKTGNQGTNYPAHLFEKWNTRVEVVNTLVSWNAGNVDSVFNAADANTYTFNDDGTCTLAGVDNTYTVENGVITFGTALTGTEFKLIWITMTGTELKAIDFSKYGPETDLSDCSFPGIWIGQRNGEKSEYQAVQLVKQ